MDDLPPVPRRSGALAYRTASGEWVVACPHEALYSTATMVATHRWDDNKKIWINLEDEE